MLKKIISASFLLFIFVPFTVAASSQHEATQQLRNFLSDVDAGNYESCWYQSSDILKRSKPLDRFIQDEESTRYFFGNVIERYDLIVKERSSLPKLPDGQYVLFVISTKFEHKQSAKEIVALRKEADGQWRVVSYDLK